jgi:hypothetical protein
MVQRENINELISNAGFGGVDLLSIDIGWQRLLDLGRPHRGRARVVIIEIHIEFGINPIVVPYDKDYCYPGKHP